MVLPADVDRLSAADLKSLVLKLLEEVSDLRRTVAAQRDEIPAQRWTGPAEYQTEWHGQGDRTEVADGFGRTAAEGQQNIEAFDPRRADHQGHSPAARLALQRL